MKDSGRMAIICEDTHYSTAHKDYKLIEIVLFVKPSFKMGERVSFLT